MKNIGMIYGRTQEWIYKNKIALAVVVFVGIATLILLNVSVAPFKVNGGAIWLKGGIHYISDTQIADKIEEINAPAESKMASEISETTQSCDAIETGYCQEATGDFVDKELVTAAIPYKAAVPDTEELLRYCTACNDGTFSPSCAVGRGACSWHSGVAAYDVPMYRTISGTPEVPAQPAVYTYAPKSYKASPNYQSPAQPDLATIAGY